jgi:hypothetical protein
VNGTHGTDPFDLLADSLLGPSFDRSLTCGDTLDFYSSSAIGISRPGGGDSLANWRPDAALGKVPRSLLSLSTVDPWREFTFQNDHRIFG